MYTRTFKCTGFDGKPYEVTYDFHLSRADLWKINMGSFYGLDVLMQKLIDSHNGKEIMRIVDEIIMTAVGKESLDHRRFLQDEDIKKDFRESEAYSQLFEELVTDAKKAAAFLNACIPDSVKKTMVEEAKEAEKAEKEA